LSRFSKEYGVPQPRLTPATERALAAHPWAGNVRELRNVIERAVLLHRGEALDPADVTPEIPGATSYDAPIPFPATLSEITRAAVVAMVDRCNGNKSEASRRLGISRPRLLRLLDGRVDDNTDTEV
jgi:DNA-binding NtrC family response regulator